jgi:FkbM family methyltransferase
VAGRGRHPVTVRRHLAPGPSVQRGQGDAIVETRPCCLRPRRTFPLVTWTAAVKGACMYSASSTSAFRRLGAIATDFACMTLGRRQVVRTTRFMLRRASLDLDVPNDMQINGEECLQRWVLDLVPQDRKVHVLDVGANIGQWSASMLTVALHEGRAEDLDLHSFEPSSYTFARLSKLLESHRLNLRHVALSERSGSSLLHVMGKGAPTNSLYALPVMPPNTTTEDVVTTTLEEYAAGFGLGNIALVKIDTEGHDLAVLRGAGTLLKERRISVVQFEYNWRWILARSFLYDAFRLLEPHGYRLGKLTPRGVEFYPRWDPDLETFVQGNYIAAIPEVAARLPAVAWWKPSGAGFR